MSEPMIGILVDDAETVPVKSGSSFDPEGISKTLADIIKASDPKYSIGIYGEWGTGKTTLMKLIESKLRPFTFEWENIPNNVSASSELKNFLKEKFNLHWLNDMYNFSKVDKNRVIKLNDGSNFLSLFPNKGFDRVILSVNNETRAEFISEYKNTSLRVRENNILTVWFNAWKYESEENFALIPLMKTIAYAMDSYYVYKKLKEKIWLGIAAVGKDILRHYSLKYLMTDKGIEEFENIFNDKLERSHELDKDAIYFDGMRKIENEMQNLRKDMDITRVVVFIDDLDRCSPEKALEIFESIKVFLDMRGFIFVLGLSREALDKVIEAKFQKIGLSDVTAEQYIRKIIQVEVPIQKWTEEGIQNLIHNVLAKKLNNEFGDHIKSNMGLIGMAVETNPREVKRFINKYVVFRTCNPEKNPTKYLAIQALRKTWKKFYEYYCYIDKPEEQFGIDFRRWIEKWILASSHDRQLHFDKVLVKQSTELDPDDERFAKTLTDIRSEFLDTKLWDFLWKYKHELIFDDVQELKGYKDIIESSNITIDYGLQTGDTELRNRRRDAYIELWPRFRLLLSDFQETQGKREGRTFIRSYRSLKDFFGKLYNWYYDYSGGLFMTKDSKDLFNGLLKGIHIALSEKSKKNADDEDPVDEKFIIEIKKKAHDLQENMIKEITSK